MNKSEKAARLSMLASMVIFGSIGIFRRYIPLSSGVIAFARGTIGTIFLLLLMKLRRQKIDRPAIKKRFGLILISGALLGFNWILLFEAYQYTSVAVATLCYYMAPIFVVLVSPVLLGERVTLKKVLCVLGALVGAALVSGIGREGFTAGQSKGILLGLAAAALYASVILLNKKITGVPAYDKTILQLGTSAVILIPYILLTGGWGTQNVAPLTIILLLVVGVVHTGIAYAFYFGSMDSLSAQTVALLGYVDPLAAIMLSALILREPMGVQEILGAVLVLGTTLISELPEKNGMKD